MRKSAPSRRRALHSTAATAAVVAAGSDSNANLTRCSSEQLKSVTVGFPSHSECASGSSYSFSLVTEPPTDEQITKMCSLPACRATLDEIRRVCQEECLLGSDTKPLQLNKDLLTPIDVRCGFGGGPTASEEAGTPEMSDMNRSIQSTTRSASGAHSGLSIGAIVAMLLGGIACGLLAAFVVHRVELRREAMAKRHNNDDDDDEQLNYDDQDPHDPQQHPYQQTQSSSSVHYSYDEADDSFSQREYDEFAAIAVSSKVSSSSNGSKHSVSSYHDSTTIRKSSLTVDSAGIQLDDPILAPLRLRLEELHVGELLRRDTYSEVYRGTYQSHHNVVAIQKLTPERRHDLKQVDQFLNQTKCMAMLRHERILGIVGVAWDTLLLDLCVVTPFAAGGDLRSLLTRFTKERRPVGFCRDKIKIALHVAQALRYLHTQDPIVVHRGLTSQNVLLTEQLDALVTNVGISHDSSGHSIAPEVVRGERYDATADVYSFGVLLAEIDTHTLPPSPKVLSFSERADPDMVQLGQSCVARDPRERPTSAAIVQRITHVMKSYEAFV